MNVFTKITCPLLIIFCCTNIVWAQCPQGSVSFSSQVEVDNFAVLYPNCTQITDHLSIGEYENFDITNLNPLAQITSIEGGLNILSNQNLASLNGLESLTSIGGDLNILSNENLAGLNGLENLTSIEGDLIISDNQDLVSLNGLENLTSVGNGGLGGGYIQIGYNTNLVDLSGLRNVASDVGIQISNNESLGTLDDLADLNLTGVYLVNNDNLLNLNGLEGLISAEWDMAIRDNDNLMSLSGLENLVTVGAGLDISNNDNLTNLGALANLISTGGELIIRDNNALMNLTGLENITSVNNLNIDNNDNLINLSGLDNLTWVHNFNIKDNDALVDLSHLATLDSIAGTLSIRANSSLGSLNGLNNVSSVGVFQVHNNDNLLDLSGLEGVTSLEGDGFINIYDNANLVSLNGLHNIDHNSITALNIYDNPTLSGCNLWTFCAYLENGGIANIDNNASGCGSAVEVLAVCSSIPRIQTNIFYDLNQNQIQDGSEANYHDIPILIEPTSDLYYAQNGIIYIEPGNYTAIFDEANNPNWQLTTDAASYSLSLEEGDAETLTFGIYPTQQISDIQAITNFPPLRCNDTLALDFMIKNLGTTVASGTMWLTIDDDVPAFNFIQQPDTSIVNTRTYGWYFSDLFPSQSIEKQVDIQVPGPPDFTLGDYIVFGAYVDFEDANGGQSSPYFGHAGEVRCSYDPNDKLVNPNREGDYVLFEEDLIYTIRFQNTGNDVAYDVVIQDTLDTNLDLSTFRLLGSSHANLLNTILNEDEGILTFEFRDIFLPDSTTNFEASQGYVNYLISPFDGLAEETPITNSAGIYFDLNPPIITNTTQSIMVSELPTVSVENPDNSFVFNVLPNPNKGIFTIQNIPNGTYQIHNTSGQIIQEGNVQNDLLIDISSETQGVYFISITIDNETLVRRIIKM